MELTKQESNEQLLGQNDLLDLGGTLIDLGDLGVAHQALDVVLLHEAVAAQHLDCIGGDLHGSLSGDHLGLGGGEGEGLASVLVAGCLVHHVLGHLDLGGQIDHTEGQVLVLVQRLLELLALHQVLPSDLESALCDAQSLGSDADAAAVQGLQCGVEALAGRRDHVGHGHMHVGEVQLADHGAADAHGVVAGADGEARGVLLHDKGSHALGAQLVVGQSVDGEVIRQRAVGDEALALSKGQHAADVGAGGVLGQAERTQVVALQDRGQEALELLIGGLGEVQAAALQRGCHGEGHGQGGVDLRDLLDGQSVLHIAQALAAIFLFIGQADEAHAAQVFIQAAVILAGLVPLQDLGCDLFLGKVAGHLLDGKLLFVQFKIHNGIVSFFH